MVLSVLALFAPPPLCCAVWPVGLSHHWSVSQLQITRVLICVRRISCLGIAFVAPFLPNTALLMFIIIWYGVLLCPCYVTMWNIGQAHDWNCCLYRNTQAAQTLRSGPGRGEHHSLSRRICQFGTGLCFCPLFSQLSLHSQWGMVFSYASKHSMQLCLKSSHSSTAANQKVRTSALFGFGTQIFTVGMFFVVLFGTFYLMR